MFTPIKDLVPDTKNKVSVVGVVAGFKQVVRAAGNKRGPPPPSMQGSDFE